MIDGILEILVRFIEGFISTFGAFGISILMAIESCNVPLPSEAILPFAGYLVTIGKLPNIHIAALFGAIGCILGSVPSYYIGYFGGRPFIEKYGKYFFVSKEDLENADKWVDKYGDWSFFLCRMLPVIRTFISLPAGILKARKRTFFLLTFLGSLIWSYVLVYVGIVLGENFHTLKTIWHKFDLLIVTVCLLLGFIYIFKHVNKNK